MKFENSSITFWLIGICVIVFILQYIFPAITDVLSFTPQYAFARPWTFVTSIFLHASWIHILFNMISLFFFGIYLEQKISKQNYLFIFLLSGIIGNITFMFLTPPDISGLGASGAIFGIMATLAILMPRAVVFVSGIPMPMFIAVIFWFILNFLGLFSPSDIGYSAHLGGLLVGVIAGFYFRNRMNKNAFIFKQTY